MVLYILPFYLALLQLGNNSSEATTLHFDILFKDEVVGNLEASKFLDDSMLRYSSTSSLGVKILKDFQVDYDFEVYFEDGMLKKSDVDITINQKPHAQTSVEWTNKAYAIEVNGKKEAVLKDSIVYSTIMLYFREPMGIERCFSEQNGSFNDLVALGKHRYKKINSKGRENIYQYENGALKEANIDGGIVEFQMVAKD